MDFPKSKLKFTTTYKGKTDPSGWIVLEIQGVDLEGASKIYIPMEDVDDARKRGDAASERLNAARSLLGGIGSDE